MLKFFRKIRQKLLSEGRTGKYLLYAIGEIILVVIGILIALAINNWNENQKNSAKEYKYLSNINREIIGDSLALERSWFKNKGRKVEGLNLGKQFILGNMTPQDTLEFINAVGFGGVNSRAAFAGSSGAYQEMLSTGNLSLISNDSIRMRIVSYYNNKEFLDDYFVNIRTDFANYFNALKVYNPKDSELVKSDEIERIINKMKTDEFLSLINQELTYAYSMDRILEEYKSEANKLSENIEAFLRKEK